MYGEPVYLFGDEIIGIFSCFLESNYTMKDWKFQRGIDFLGQTRLGL